MKRNNREALQRAIGIIEGASYGAKSHVQDALTNALEILDAVLDDEEQKDPEEGNSNTNERS